MTDLHPRPRMEMTAELVRQRLYQLGADAEFHYSDTHVWLEMGGRRFSIYDWREWWRPSLEAREDRAIDVAAHLTRPAEQR